MKIHAESLLLQNQLFERARENELSCPLNRDCYLESKEVLAP